MIETNKTKILLNNLLSSDKLKEQFSPTLIEDFKLWLHKLKADSIEEIIQKINDPHDLMMISYAVEVEDEYLLKVACLECLKLYFDDYFFSNLYVMFRSRVYNDFILNLRLTKCLPHISQDVDIQNSINYLINNEFKKCIGLISIFLTKKRYPLPSLHNLDAVMDYHEIYSKKNIAQIVKKHIGETIKNKIYYHAKNLK
jgi:hypothetical protein